MSRATYIYIFMLVVFGIGIWAILSFGSIYLRAPENLAGRWDLYDMEADIDDDPIFEMYVDQSGRFFKVTLDGVAKDLKLVETHTFADRGRARVRLLLWGRHGAMTFTGTQGGNQFRVTAEHPVSGTWRAVRHDEPLQPVDVTASRALH